MSDRNKQITNEHPQVSSARITAMYGLYGVIITAIGTVVAALTSGLVFEHKISMDGFVYTACQEANITKSADIKELVAVCDSDDTVTGGGWECRNRDGCEKLSIRRSLPTAKNRWEVDATSTYEGEALSVRAYAQCISTSGVPKPAKACQ